MSEEKPMKAVATYKVVALTFEQAVALCEWLLNQFKPDMHACVKDGLTRGRA